MEDKTTNKLYNLNLDYDATLERIKSLETSLKEKEAQFIEAQSIANFGFWEIDPVTRKSTWSEGIYNIVGLTPKNEDINYFALKELIHPLDIDHFYNAKEEALLIGKDVELDIKLMRSDNSWRNVHIIVKPKRDKSGKIVGVKGTAQDISDLKKVENELKTSETFYRTLFENTGTASIIVEADTTILMANTKFENLSGYSKEDLEGITSWKEMVLPEDLTMLENYHYMRRYNIEDPPDNYETRVIDKEGNIRIVYLEVSMIPSTKMSIISLVDLTERKEIERKLADSERRYRYIVDKATSGIFILNNNGKIKYLNDHMAYILGYTVNEMLEADIKNFVDEVEDFYTPKNPSDNQIESYVWFKFLQKDGNIFWSNLTISPIFNSENEYTGCLGIVTDSNMQKGLEESFLAREEIFTDIIYSMMETLNNAVNSKNNSELKEKELSTYKNLDNN
jgi:PAS domain S-box-containing protein